MVFSYDFYTCRLGFSHIFERTFHDIVFQVTDTLDDIVGIAVIGRNGERVCLPVFDIIQFHRIGILRSQIRVTERDIGRVGDIQEGVQLMPPGTVDPSAVIQLDFILGRQGVS